jgi:hypothetical protein
MDLGLGDGPGGVDTGSATLGNGVIFVSTTFHFAGPGDGEGRVRLRSSRDNDGWGGGGGFEGGT